MININDEMPNSNIDILFFYQDIFHIGYFESVSICKNKIIWKWISYTKNFEEPICDYVEWWENLPIMN